MDLGAVIESERGVFIENVRKTIEKRDNLKHLSTIKGMDQRVADRMRFAQASEAIKRNNFAEEDSDKETASVIT